VWPEVAPLDAGGLLESRKQGLTHPAVGKHPRIPLPKHQLEDSRSPYPDNGTATII
jgi:hypothetical protein